MSAKPTPYFVRFGASSALRVEDARTILGPNFSLRVSDALRESKNSEQLEHSGLLFSVELEAPELVTAIQQSTATVASIADLLASTHATAIGDPVFLFAADLDTEKNDRQFAQGINNAPALDEVRRTFSDDLFRPLFSLFTAVRAADQSLSKKHLVEPRLVRTLHYVRRSYLEIDQLDRFEDLAAALQSLDPLLRRKHNLPTKFSEPCRQCHAPLLCKECLAKSEKEDNWSGTDYVITKLLKRSESEARRLRKKRNDIAHALKQVPDLLTDLDELTGLAHEAALAGLLEVLGANPTEILQPLPLLTTPEFIVTATLHNLPVDQMRNRDRYPLLKLISLEVGKSMSSSDTLLERASFAALNMLADNFDEDWSPGSVYSRLPPHANAALPDPRIIVQKLKSRRS